MRIFSLIKSLDLNIFYAEKFPHKILVTTQLLIYLVIPPSFAAYNGRKDWSEYKRLAHDIYSIPRWVSHLAEILYPPARLAFFVKRYYKNMFSS